MKRILRNRGVVAAAVTVAFLLLPSGRHVHAGARSSAATAADAVKTIRLVKNPTPVPTFALQALDGTPHFTGPVARQGGDFGVLGDVVPAVPGGNP